MAEELNANAPVSQASLIETIVDQLQEVVEEAESKVKALEMEPYRGRLFELFVTADGAGLTDEELEPNLSSDAVAGMLAERWGLRTEANTSFAQQTAMSSESMAKVRLLWSLLRMWMEWSYAWDRWREFHDNPASKTPR